MIRCCHRSPEALLHEFQTWNGLESRLQEVACLAEGMSHADIVREYSVFSRESIAELLRFAAEVSDRHDVVA